MKKIIILLLLSPAFFPVFSQKNKIISIPMEAKKWKSEPETVVFATIDGVKSMKLMPNSGKVVLQDFDFSIGTIEFDIQPLAPAFSSLYFRYKDENENECFYFRNARSEKPFAPDAVQYAPFLSGVNLWDMMGHYQTNANFKKDEWNHVKLEISNSQMRVYVNSEKPILEIPRLEGNTKSGTIAFDGEMLLANLRISHAEVAGLSHAPGADPTDYDPRYIRTWKVSQPITPPEKIDFSFEFLPNESTQWEEIKAETRGLINLTRKFGKSEARRLVWLKATIKSDKAQKGRIDLGFSDEVWVFLNGQMIFLDKNPYNRPMMKEPDGRISIENAAFELSLLEGYNDLKIGVANDFYGWGVMARLDKIDGIELLSDDAVYYFGRKMVDLNDQVIENYTGSYLREDGRKLSIAKEENGLKISGDDLPTVVFYPESEKRFFLKEFNVQLEFIEDDTKGINTVKFFENGNEVLKYEKME